MVPRVSIIYGPGSHAGLFFFLLGVAHWVEHLQAEPDKMLVIADQCNSRSRTSIFSHLFCSPDRQNVAVIGSGAVLPSTQTDSYPWSEGRKLFETIKNIAYEGAYDGAAFAAYRALMGPIIREIFQPRPELLARIGEVQTKLAGRHSVGIHVRYIGHYDGCEDSESMFLNKIEADVATVMEGRQTSVIFLSTLLGPVKERICARWPTVCQDYVRTSDCRTDWTQHGSNAGQTEAEEAVIDTWTLATCDEIWVGASNMVLFATCLNPNLSVHTLSSLAPFHGA